MRRRPDLNDLGFLVLLARLDADGDLTPVQTSRGEGAAADRLDRAGLVQLSPIDRGVPRGYRITEAGRRVVDSMMRLTERPSAVRIASALRSAADEMRPDPPTGWPKPIVESLIEASEILDPVSLRRTKTER